MGSMSGCPLTQIFFSMTNKGDGEGFPDDSENRGGTRTHYKTFFF